MSSHPNTILLLTLTPDDLSRKTYRNLLKETSTETDDEITINGVDYHHKIMESGYDDSFQITAKEGDIVLLDMVTYGYGEAIEWDGREEQIENDKKLNHLTNKVYEYPKPRTMEDLDKNKIDYLCLPHTHFSMIKQGVFSKGTTKIEVEKIVKGTFGGRFDYFSDTKCQFKYIAYTD